MPDSIIITKLSNGNVEVSRNGIRYTRNSDSLAFEDAKRGGCIIKHKNGSEVDFFPVVEVEKVIRADTTEVLIPDLNTLYNELSEFFFFKSGGGTSLGTGQFFAFVEANYTDLITNQPGPHTTGTAAYVSNSQGTAWWPAQLGGTDFYEKGIYIWNGADWISDRNAIADALNDNLVVIDTVDPTVNDDVDLGYNVGRPWVNTVLKRSFILIANPDGAADWIQTGGNSIWEVQIQGIVTVTHNNDFLLTPAFSGQAGFVYRVLFRAKDTLNMVVFYGIYGTDFDDGAGYAYSSMQGNGTLEARGRYNDGSGMGGSADFYYKVEKSFVGIT